MKTAIVILFAVLPVFAQPPKVLRVFREDIKYGKSAAHERSEAAFMQAAAKANFPAHILGLTNITGISQAVFLEQFDSFASIPEAEAVLDRPEFRPLDAADAELRINQRSILAAYRPDLSYAADKLNLPKMRFFSIETIRVREGRAQKFEERAKMVVAGAEKSGDAQPVAVYQAVSGAPGGTYLLIEPMESLKSLDEAGQREQALIQATAGASETMRELSETIANEESILFAVNPQMSYVPKEWITTSPDFWTPKPVPAATKAPAAKPAVKKAAK